MILHRFTELKPNIVLLLRKCAVVHAAIQEMIDRQQARDPFLKVETFARDLVDYIMRSVCVYCVVVGLVWQSELGLEWARIRGRHVSWSILGRIR
jgi:hypothetical protein